LTAIAAFAGLGHYKNTTPVITRIQQDATSSGKTEQSKRKGWDYLDPTNSFNTFCSYLFDLSFMQLPGLHYTTIFMNNNQPSLSSGKANARSYMSTGRLQDARILLGQLCTQYKSDAEAWHLLATVCGMLGLFDESERCSRQVLELNPDTQAAYNNLGMALLQQGKYTHAQEALEKAVRLNESDPQARARLGIVHFHIGNYKMALGCFRKALRKYPESSELQCYMGMALRNTGHLDEAAEAIRLAIDLQPDSVEAHNVLGAVYFDQGGYDQAINCYQKAVSLKPEYTEAINNLGMAYQAQGKHENAIACFQQVTSINPGNAAARWACAIAQIPLFYWPEMDPAVYRDRFSLELAKLDSWFDDSKTKQGYQVVGSFQPFYLSYQEENNRDLLSRYGVLCARLMKSWLDSQGFSTGKSVTRKPARIGIVSGQIRNHSVWNSFVKGWFRHLDRKRFEILVFHLDPSQDDETAWARAHSAIFFQGGKTLHEWVNVILESQAEVLIYPEIGIDPMTVKLASLRLAPTQVAAWGHPETTGLPTMDYYLSAEDFEPQDAQGNYVEQLVALPHLGCCYQSLPVTPVDFDFTGNGIHPEIPVLLCPGSPFKYLPRHDRIFTEIAAKLGQCQFVFFITHFSALTVNLQQRLETAFSNANMKLSDYVTFIPWQERAAFYSLMKHARIFLDTIGFSGFNTAIQAMECGLPLVTMDGRFMRGRLASGILRRLGLPELITDCEEDYVALAVKLVQDSDYYRQIQQRIKADRHLLIDDITPVRALEDFLTTTINKQRGSTRAADLE
jgi:predicted O-linked N-acetylglucosamine transferase (SPINDLY family)